MASLRVVKDGDAAAGLSGAVLFKILWDELVDILGTTATAVVMERALRRARTASRELGGLTITRVDGQFSYAVPVAFVQAVGPSVALSSLVDELRPLLVELTGQVAVQHLGRVPELRGWAPPPPGPQASS
jgi:hypothetical protein